jgi:ABC-type uncharacterized transport system substrate-binding protein
MDTKRNSDEAYIRQITEAIIEKINRMQPDVIIASDDNAVKYVISAHLKETRIPVVFCGVNWSAEQYQLPSDHITGMLEILPFEQGVKLASKFNPELQKVFVLSEHTISEQKNTVYIADIAEDLQIDLSYTLAENFSDWMQGFLEGNETSDLIYIPTNGAIKNWDKEMAIEFIKVHIKKPVITCDDFMMPYAVFGLTKIQSEQGIWAAETALQILNGRNVGSIRVVKNQQTQVWYNPILVDILEIKLDKSFIKESKVFEY